VVITFPHIGFWVCSNGGLLSLNYTKCLFIGLIAGFFCGCVECFWLDLGAGNIVEYLSKSLFFELGGASNGFNSTGAI
jgi:hypothetical protein